MTCCVSRVPWPATSLGETATWSNFQALSPQVACPVLPFASLPPDLLASPLPLLLCLTLLSFPWPHCPLFPSASLSPSHLPQLPPSHLPHRPLIVPFSHLPHCPLCRIVSPTSPYAILSPTLSPTFSHGKVFPYATFCHQLSLLPHSLFFPLRPPFRCRHRLSLSLFSDFPLRPPFAVHSMFPRRPPCVFVLLLACVISPLALLGVAGLNTGQCTIFRVSVV